MHTYIRKKHKNCLKMFWITSTQCCQELKLNIGEAAWKKRRSYLKWWAQLRDVPLPKIHEVFFLLHNQPMFFFLPDLETSWGFGRGKTPDFQTCQIDSVRMPIGKTRRWLQSCGHVRMWIVWVKHCLIQLWYIIYISVLANIHSIFLYTHIHIYMCKYVLINVGSNMSRW